MFSEAVELEGELSGVHHLARTSSMEMISNPEEYSDTVDVSASSEGLYTAYTDLLYYLRILIILLEYTKIYKYEKTTTTIYESPMLS